jgi:hypothetical protein
VPTFSPPTRNEGSSDPFFGRYSIPVGQSVVKTNGIFVTTPYPWLGDIADLEEGVEWFQGGREYVISDEVATELLAAGYMVGPDFGYGEGPYGAGGFGN